MLPRLRWMNVWLARRVRIYMIYKLLIMIHFFEGG